MPEHIQSFFIVYKKQVFTSDVFINYWKQYNIETMNSFMDVVNNHEVKFTKFLSDNGFKYDVYVKDTYHDELYNYNHYAYNSSDQIINNNGVFLKKKNMGFSIEEYNYLADYPDLRKSIDYIKNNTDYDIHMIWKNALRIYPLTDISYAYGFDKVVIEKSDVQDRINDLSLIIINNSTSHIDEIINKTSYINNRVFICLNNDVKDYLDERNINGVLVNDAKGLINVLNSIKTKYFMLMNACINSELDIVDYSKQVSCFDNLISSKNYLNNVLDIFINENISVLYSPESVNFDRFYLNLFWGNELLQECIKLLVDYKPGIDYSHPPVSLSQSFICRTSVLNHFNFGELNKYDIDTLIRIISVCVAYYGTFDYMVPQIVYSPSGIEYRTSVYKYIYKKTYRTIYENNYYPATLIEVTKSLNKTKSPNRIKIFLKRIKNKLWRNKK